MSELNADVHCLDISLWLVTWVYTSGVFYSQAPFAVPSPAFFIADIAIVLFYRRSWSSRSFELSQIQCHYKQLLTLVDQQLVPVIPKVR